jgi:hypothetical protein
MKSLLKKLETEKPKITSQTYQKAISEISEVTHLTREDSDKGVQHLNLKLKQKKIKKKIRANF